MMKCVVDNELHLKLCIYKKKQQRNISSFFNLGKILAIARNYVH